MFRIVRQLVVQRSVIDCYLRERMGRDVGDRLSPEVDTPAISKACPILIRSPEGHAISSLNPELQPGALNAGLSLANNAAGCALSGWEEGTCPGSCP